MPAAQTIERVVRAAEALGVTRFVSKTPEAHESATKFCYGRNWAMMSQDELVANLNLKNKAQLDDMIAKFKAFYAGLDDDQRNVVRRSLPSLHEALTWLGPDVTVDQLRELFGGAFHTNGEPIMVCHFAHTHRVS